MLAVALLLVQEGMREDPRDAHAAEDPRAVLEALIERTNALGSFRATYKIEEPGREEATVLFLYSAPHRLRMDKSGPGAGEQMRMVAVDGRLCTVGSTATEELIYALADMRPLDPSELPAFRVLDRLFPEIHGHHLGPGPAVEFSWKLSSETNKVDLTLSLAWSVHPRHVLLGWLSTLKGQPELLELEDELLMQSHERHRASVSRSSGFLEALDLVAADGAVMTLRLERLEIDPEFDPSLFEIPDRPEGARDQSAQLEQVLSRMLHPSHVRRYCFLRMDRQLADGSREWNERTREDCQAVLQAVHEAPLLEQAGHYRGEMKKHLDRLCTWIANDRARQVPPEQMREKVREQRLKVEEQLEAIRAQWQSQLALSPLELARSERAWDLRELEQRVVAELLEEKIRRPILDDFDERTEESLGS